MGMVERMGWTDPWFVSAHRASSGVGGWLAASVALVALGSSACRPECPPRAGSDEWTNASCTVSVEPDVLTSPANAVELTSAVRAAAAGGKRVRMTGSGHSYSDAAVSREHLLLPQKLNRVLELERAELRPEIAADPHLVRVQSGITLRELNRALAERGLALENLGGYDAQTLAGVMMTATHGSGLAFGPIVSQVVSIQIVSDGGELLQIEPSAGITDAARFSGRLHEADGDSLPVRLIQQDDVFHAVGVSMGSMGVVYAVVVKTVDAYWIRERRSVVDWEELAKPGGFLARYLAAPGGASFPDHVEVTINPYPAHPGKSTHAALLTERWRLAAAPPGTPENRQRGLLGSGNLFADPLVRDWTEKALVHHLDQAKPLALGQTLQGFLGVLKDDEYVAPSYEVFNLGDINRFRVYGIEVAVDLGQTFDAAALMFRLAGEQLEEGRHHSVPVSLRFVKAADAFLAMQHGRNTTMIEVGMLVEASGSEELLEAYEKEYIRALGARPHWGLDLSILKSRAEVERLYPRFGDWYGVYRTLNAHGTFDGDLTDRLGISMGD